MNDTLLIVFAKNKLLGKVKTRLAKTIGAQDALRVYERLLEITEKASSQIEGVDLRIYYSHAIDDSSWVQHNDKYVQVGESLGERMGNAFEKGFQDGYKKIIGIGADLDKMDQQTILDAKHLLQTNDFVFGPAADGGYYLIGLNGKKGGYVFIDKPWSTSSLLQVTLEEINTNNHQYALMDTRNDIDNIEDLRQSSIAVEFAGIF